MYKTRRHRLPDGVGTNGVVAEVPQFPLMIFHGKMFATYDNIWQHVTTCDNILQNVATRAQSKRNLTKLKEMWPFCENPVCPDLVWKPANAGPGV